MAAERAVLAHQGVIDDPVASAMLGPAIGTLYRAVRRRPQVIPTLPVTLAGLAARVLWHDERLVEAMGEGTDQVVILGAGFDSRAWRLRRSGIRFFEVDGAATQAQKIRRAPPLGPIYVPADLRAPSVAPVLAAAGLDLAKPAIFILEGVTMYLSEPDVRRLFEDLGSSAAPGSTITTDFYPPTDADNIVNQRQNRVQRMARAGSGETLRLLVDRAAASDLVEASGWVVRHTSGMQDAASALLPESHQLPVRDVNNRKTLLSAVL